MSTKEIIFIFFIVFICGFVASQIINTDLSATASIPILVMVGAYLGIIFNRIKHIDDLNLSLKKDVSLEFVEDMSEYGTILVSLIEPTSTMESFYSDLNKINKKLSSSMNKFHVICNDEVSSEVELIYFDYIGLMQLMARKATELGEKKIALMKWFIKEDVFSQLNIIRYKVISLVNSEIGDGSGTENFKRAINKSNTDYKKAFSKLLENIED